MEIHAPQQPIFSVKEALVHLGIVTIGILIALSLEGLVEWQHHRHLIGEARHNVADEIRDNNKLQHFLAAVPKLRSDDLHALNLFDAIAAHRLPKNASLTVAFSRPDLSNASWTTAQTIGALGLMNYQEVKRYAAVYELQDEFLRLQSKTLDAVILATSTFEQNRSPEDLPTADLQVARQAILNVMSGLQTEQQIGEQLQKRYEDVLTRR